MKEAILIVMTMVLVDNLFLSKAIGMTTAIHIQNKVGEAIRTSVLVSVGICVMTAIAWPISKVILEPYGLLHLQIVLFMPLAVLIGSFISKEMHGGTFLYSANCIIFGGALINLSSGYNYAQALLSSIGIGVGFLIAMTIFASIIEVVDKEKGIPKAFKGLPIHLAVASILSLVFMSIGEVVASFLYY